MSLGRWLRPSVCQSAFFLWSGLLDPGPPHNHLYWGKKKPSALKDSLGSLSFWKIIEFIFKCIEGKLLGLMEHCAKKALYFLIFSHTQSDLEQDWIYNTARCLWSVKSQARSCSRQLTLHRDKDLVTGQISLPTTAPASNIQYEGRIHSLEPFILG